MHVAIRACSRALPKEGSKMAISNAMMEITTSTSINVNAFILCFRIAKNSFNNQLELFFLSRQIFVLLAFYLSFFYYTSTTLRVK